MGILDKRFSLVQRIVEVNPVYQRPDYGWVLMFHEITTDLSDEREDITITPTSFWKLVSSLEEINIQFCDIKNLLEEKQANRVFLTFDDVCDSAYQNAMIELEKRKIPFCCFISPNFVEKERFINKEQLEHLFESDFCRVNAHGMNHELLRGKDPDSIANEIGESLRYIREYSKEDSDLYFAYPYGSKYAVSQTAIDYCRKNAEMAFGTYRLPLNKRFVDNNPFFLPRVNINESNYQAIAKKIADGIK